MEAVKKAMRLNPNPPFWYFWILGYAQYGAKQYEAAVIAFRSINDPLPDVRRMLAASLARSGRVTEAQAEMAKAISEEPGYSLAEFAKDQPFKNAEDLEQYLAGLRLAGLPDR